MLNPWHPKRNSFLVFYDEVVSFTTKENKTISLRCYISTDEDVDAGDGIIDTDVTQIHICIAPEDQRLADTLKRGDTVRREHNRKKYKVAKVEDDPIFGTILLAKEI